MYTIVPERPEDAALIEPLLDLSFGTDRFAKTVYRLRDGIAPVPGLSFVALDEAGSMQANIRYWPVRIGADSPAVLLGPLAVNPARRGEGMGKALVRHSLVEAARLGHRLCVLVGDPQYYRPFGFGPAAVHGLELPGWVELSRFQVRELAPGALAGLPAAGSRMIDRVEPAPMPARRRRRR